MPTPKIKLELEAQKISRGLKNVRAELERLTQAELKRQQAFRDAGRSQRQVADATRNLARETQRTTQAQVDNTRSTQQAQRALLQLRSTLGGAERATSQLAVANQRLATASRAGIISQQEQARLQGLINSTFTTSNINAKDLRKNMQSLQGSVGGLNLKAAGLSTQLSAVLSAMTPLTGSAAGLSSAMTGLLSAGFTPIALALTGAFGLITLLSRFNSEQERGAESANRFNEALKNQAKSLTDLTDKLKVARGVLTQPQLEIAQLRREAAAAREPVQHRLERLAVEEQRALEREAIRGIPAAPILASVERQRREAQQQLQAIDRQLRGEIELIQRRAQEREREPSRRPGAVELRSVPIDEPQDLIFERTRSEVQADETLTQKLNEEIAERESARRRAANEAIRLAEEQAAAQLQADAALTEKLNQGIEERVEKERRTAEENAAQLKRQEQLITELSHAGSVVFKSILTDANNVGDAFSNVAQRLADVALELLVIQPLVTALKTSLKGLDIVSGIGGVLGFLGLFAEKGLVARGLPPNTIVDRPTLFPSARPGLRKFQFGGILAGEAGPEAILPLQRGPGGRLGVQGSGVVVNIFNNSGSRVRTETGRGRFGERELRIFIDDMVGESIESGGRTMRAIQNTFGVGPRLTGR